jgi:hypothetical protein
MYMRALKPGGQVILTSAPSSLLEELPQEDQIAVQSIVGKPVTLEGFEYGQAVLEFKDDRGEYHWIWVDTDLIKPA